MQLVTCVIDTGDHYFPDVITSFYMIRLFLSVANDTSNQFVAGIITTGNNLIAEKFAANFRE